MEFPIILIKTLLIYFKPCSLTVRLQKSFKWDQIKSGTVSRMALALISKVFLLCLSMNPSTKKTQTCQMDLLIRYWNEEKIHMSRLNFTEMFNCELELLKLIDIGSCSLHIIYSVFKKRVESTDWEIKKTLKAASPYFSCKEKWLHQHHWRHCIPNFILRYQVGGGQNSDGKIDQYLAIYCQN